MNKRLNVSFIILMVFAIGASAITAALLAKSLPLFVTKALYFCQQFISNTVLQIPTTIPGLFIVALGVSLLIGALSFLVQLARTHQLLKVLLAKKVSINKTVEEIACSVGLASKIDLIRDESLFSFCHGIFSPRIVITTALAESLSTKELEAVFLHEKAHLESFDPLKILVGKTVSSMFFFLPIFSELYQNMTANSELSADRFTTEWQKETAHLRAAIRKILATPQVVLANVPAIYNGDCLEVRIQQLINPAIKSRSSLSALSILTSFLFIGVSSFLLQAPVAAFSDSHLICPTNNSCSKECQHNPQAAQEFFSTKLAVDPSMTYSQIQK